MGKVLLNKKNVIRGLEIMVRDYGNGKIEHSCAKCKLCQMYKATEAKFLNDCGNCINTIFIYENSPYYLGCVKRKVYYPKLNFCDEINNQNLAEFWAKVLELVKVTTPSDLLNLSDDFKAKVLEIAKPYNVEPVKIEPDKVIVIEPVKETLKDKIKKFFRSW